MDWQSIRRHSPVVMLKAALSIGLLYLLIGKVDLKTVGTQFGNLSTSTLALAVLLLVGQVPILAWRWQCIIELLNGKLPFSRTFHITYVGVFFNQALPASVGGDAMRIWGSARAGLGSRIALNSVLLERLSGLFALLLIFAAMLPVVWDALARLGPLRSVLATLLPLALGGFAALYMVESGLGTMTRWPILRNAAALSADFRVVLANFGGTLSLTLLGLVSNLLAIGAVYALGRDMGLEVGFVSYLGLVSAAILATVVPISIGGWGVRESVMVALFGAVGVDAESALVLSVLFGLALIAAAAPGGVMWLLSRQPSTPRN